MRLQFIPIHVFRETPSVTFFDAGVSGTNGTDANFSFADVEYPDYARQSDFTFPNLNVALFGEQIFRVSEKLSITPGIRIEYIKTESQGAFKNIILE